VPAATRSFLADPLSVTDARELVEGMLRGCPRELVDDALLLTSELVSNVVLHAHTPFSVDVQVDGVLRVMVSDGCPDLPVVRHPAPEDLGGRGLLLVQEISSRWGCEPSGEGKVIWFELDQ
jgi:anti-sigma regulatory factor (Ser/Thr protein kinase)